MSIDSGCSTSVGIGSSRHVFGGDLRITLRSSSSEQSLNDIRVRWASVGSDRRMLRSCLRIYVYIVLGGPTKVKPTYIFVCKI